jgi:hypothetical protein
MITRFALFEGHIKPHDIALASPERSMAKAATEAILARYFTGKVHHHITEAFEVSRA